MQDYYWEYQERGQTAGTHVVIIRRGVTSGLEGTYEALERREYKIMMDILEDGNT